MAHQDQSIQWLKRSSSIIIILIIIYLNAQYFLLSGPILKKIFVFAPVRHWPSSQNHLHVHGTQTLSEVALTRTLIVISKLLKRQSKSKCRAPAYSQALRQIRGVVQRRVHGRFTSGCHRVRGGKEIYKESTKTILLICIAKAIQINRKLEVFN